MNITSLKVPLGASHEAPLDCLYDLESRPLYDVKWYKDGQQFFRCHPNGTVQEYPVEGIKMFYDKMVRVGTCPLTLTGLTSKSAGEYKCEVTVEGPPFANDVKSSRFRLIEPSPRRDYNISKGTAEMCTCAYG